MPMSPNLADYEAIDTLVANGNAERLRAYLSAQNPNLQPYGAKTRMAIQCINLRYNASLEMRKLALDLAANWVSVYDLTLLLTSNDPIGENLTTLGETRHFNLSLFKEQDIEAMPEEGIRELLAFLYANEVAHEGRPKWLDKALALRVYQISREDHAFFRTGRNALSLYATLIPDAAPAETEATDDPCQSQAYGPVPVSAFLDSDAF